MADLVEVFLKVLDGLRFELLIRSWVLRANLESGFSACRVAPAIEVSSFIQLGYLLYEVSMRPIWDGSPSRSITELQNSADGVTDELSTGNPVCDMPFGLPQGVHCITSPSPKKARIFSGLESPVQLR